MAPSTRKSVKRKNDQLTDSEPLNENEDQETEIRTAFALCNVNENVKFSFALPVWKQRTISKISENAFDEIFFFRLPDGSSRIFKCMPVDGRHPLQRDPNISLYEALPNMVSSTLLSSLNDHPFFLAPNFPTVYRISLIKDKFPERLLRSWWIYKKDPPEWFLNRFPQPDLYDKSTRFLTIETSFCGTLLPLKLQELRNYWTGVSLMSQVVSALAVAEEAFEFEHRGLHFGNILIRETEVVALNYTIQNLNFSVQTVGHQLFIKDFVLSRINKDGKVYFVGTDELDSGLPAVDDNVNTWFNPEKLFGMMFEYLHGDWSQFIPKTNVIWLKHLTEAIMLFLRRNNQLEAEPGEYDQMAAMGLLQKWSDSLLSYDSAKSFLLDVLLIDNRLVEVMNEQ